MSTEIVRWGKADPETTFKDGCMIHPRMSINLCYWNEIGWPLLTLHPFMGEVWLHSLQSYDHDFDEDGSLIAAFHTSMKGDGTIGMRIRGTNMNTLHERGEQFAKFNFEIIFEEARPTGETKEGT